MSKSAGGGRFEPSRTADGVRDFAVSDKPTDKKAWLVLADGTVFEGRSFGAKGVVDGEVVFSTNMTGFQETVTDPNYRGQILTQTFPIVGSVGVNTEDSVSDKASLSGYIVREHCLEPSNFRQDGRIDEFLKNNGTVGLYGIDTRRLTRILREKGTMNGRITDVDPGLLNADDMNGLIGRLREYRYKSEPQRVRTAEFRVKNAEYGVALIDYGYNRKIVDIANSQLCDVTVLPWNTDIGDLSGYDAVILSNGPGNPADYTEQVKAVGLMLGAGIPIIGMGLGHQLLALANGGEVFKLDKGHRGANLPVYNVRSGNVFVTAQNHGYAVKSGSVPLNAGEVLFTNVNDKTCEGILYKNAVGTQFIQDNIIGFIQCFKSQAGD